MACRLDDHVVSGEIFNTTNYSVHGWLELRGWDHPLVLQLTGNCSPDLAGWHFRFQSRNPGVGPGEEPDSAELETLAMQQIGPTGRITAVGRTGLHEPPVEEHHTRIQSGQPPRAGAKRRLVLEWFSQNGRVAVELEDPVLEFVEFRELRVSAGSPRGLIGADEEEGGGMPGPSPQGAFSAGEQDAEEEDESLLAGIDGDDEEDCDEDEDPYHLLPRDLQLQFELEASQTDWSLTEDEEKSRAIREMELMDELIENSTGVVLSELFDNPVKCPLPDKLDDEAVEAALKSLLAELALFGIALDICQHFTPREAYRLLLEQICPEERAYPELRNTRWVQHYSTSDYCEPCQAEFDREYEEYSRGMEDNSGDEPADSDDDTPF